MTKRPTPLTTVRPGSVVAIRSGEMVTLRDGQYVAAGPPIVATSPVATPGATLKRTIYGKVTDVDKDGEVEIKTDKGSFEIQLTPDSVRYIKKGTRS